MERAVEIYRRLGFVQADAKQLTDGLRYGIPVPRRRMTTRIEAYP